MGNSNSASNQPAGATTSSSSAAPEQKAQSGSVPVILHVYKPSERAAQSMPLNAGIYHSGVEVFGSGLRTKSEQLILSSLIFTTQNTTFRILFCWRTNIFHRRSLSNTHAPTCWKWMAIRSICWNCTNRYLSTRLSWSRQRTTSGVSGGFVQPHLTVCCRAIDCSFEIERCRDLPCENIVISFVNDDWCSEKMDRWTHKNKHEKSPHKWNVKSFALNLMAAREKNWTMSFFVFHWNDSTVFVEPSFLLLAN